MNTPDQQNRITSGITTFAALAVGYAVGSYRQDTTERVEVIIRKPHIGEVLPLQNAKSIIQDDTIQHASFKAAEHRLETRPMPDHFNNTPNTEDIEVQIECRKKGGHY